MLAFQDLRGQLGAGIAAARIALLASERSMVAQLHRRAARRLFRDSKNGAFPLALQT